MRISLNNWLEIREQSAYRKNCYIARLMASSSGMSGAANRPFGFKLGFEILCGNIGFVVGIISQVNRGPELRWKCLLTPEHSEERNLSSQRYNLTKYWIEAKVLTFFFIRNRKRYLNISIDLIHYIISTGCY